MNVAMPPLFLYLTIRIRSKSSTQFKASRLSCPMQALASGRFPCFTTIIRKPFPNASKLSTNKSTSRSINHRKSLGGSPFNIHGYTEYLMTHTKRRIIILIAGYGNNAPKKKRYTNAQEVSFFRIRKRE